MLVNLSRRLKTFEKFYFTASSQFAVVKSELAKIDTVQPARDGKFSRFYRTELWERNNC